LANKIGEKIRELRTAKNMSQEQLAEHLNVSTQQLHKYESGKNRIPIDNLLIICRIFDVDLNYFADMAAKPKPMLSSNEKQLIKIYKEIGSANLRKSWMDIGVELSKCWQEKD
jgi:transcriptional regulator with XRE-family HTH domain